MGFGLEKQMFLADAVGTDKVFVALLVYDEEVEVLFQQQFPALFRQLGDGVLGKIGSRQLHQVIGLQRVFLVKETSHNPHCINGLVINAAQAGVEIGLPCAASHKIIAHTVEDDAINTGQVHFLEMVH